MQEVFRNDHSTRRNFIYIHVPSFAYFALISNFSQWKFSLLGQPQNAQSKNSIWIHSTTRFAKLFRLENCQSKSLLFLLLAQCTRRLIARVGMLGLILNQQHKRAWKIFWSCRKGYFCHPPREHFGEKAFFTHTHALSRSFQFPLFTVCLFEFPNERRTNASNIIASSLTP